MAIQIQNEVIQAVAIGQIKDTLLKAQQATQGAITIGKGIHKGDFKDETFFANFGNPERRDPNTQTAVTPNRLSTLEDTAVKLYFRDDVFVTMTELERYGTTLDSMNRGIGIQLGTAIARWAIQKSLIASVAAINSEAGLVNGDGTLDVDTAMLSGSMFKLGDMYEDVKVFVAPSQITGKLLGNAIGANTDQIAYGAVYDGTVGTLGRNIWTVDSPALSWDDGTEQGHYTLGLTSGAVVVDESETIKMLNQLLTLESNAGYNFHSEGAYTVGVKGFTYDTAQGANPTDAILGASASWNLVDQIKGSAGVIAKSK